jgi:hypothetical protein
MTADLTRRGARVAIVYRPDRKGREDVLDITPDDDGEPGTVIGHPEPGVLLVAFVTEALAAVDAAKAATVPLPVPAPEPFVGNPLAAWPEPGFEVHP